MTVKEWLERGYELYNEIEKLKRKKERVIAETVGTQSITYGERVQTSMTNLPEEKYMRYLSLIEGIDKKIDKKTKIYQTVCKEIASCICEIEKKQLRKILFRRYIEVSTWQGWEKYAEDTHYSARQLKRLHKTGIEEIEKILKNSKSDIWKK